MSWTYSGDPSTSEVDALRFKLQDTNPDAPLFTDQELAYLVDTYKDNPDALEYHAFRTAATKFAYSIKRSLGPQSEDPSARLAYFNERAAAAKKKLAIKGLSLPKYQSPKLFYKGMMDNPPAIGRGDYV
nr:MAG TPA: hypothetical protein [Caudoviricetes sp.]